MKRHLAITGLAIIGLVSLPLATAAQENRAAAGSSAAGTGVAATGGGHANGGGSSGGGAGTTSSSGGGSASSGGSSGGSGGGFSGAGSGGGRVEVGGRHAATGGSGVAVSRGAERGANSGARGRDGAGTTGTRVTTAGDGNGGRATGRVGEPRGARTPDGVTAGSPPHARPRDGNEPVTGTAVPRGSVPPATGGGVIVTGGVPFYPWWFGGAGYYGGYYGGYYDPWFGGYPDPGYDPQVYGGGGSYSDEGSLKLKIKPKDAEVYVDGYYVGLVDQFDGLFQRLHIETGPHRIEVRAPGYETLTFDVRITADHSTTYTGELKRIQ